MAEIQSLVLRNDWVHDAVAGPELRSRADATTLDGDRISQTSGNGGADVALPDGGRVAITKQRALEKGANSQPAPLVDVGGGAPYAGSSVSLSADTLITDLSAPTTRFVVAEPGAAPVSASGIAFVGGAPGSVQASAGVTNTGATTRSGLAVRHRRPMDRGCPHLPPRSPRAPPRPPRPTACCRSTSRKTPSRATPASTCSSMACRSRTR